jgi:hypothetical protein
MTRYGLQAILEEIADSCTLPTGVVPQRFIDARVFRELSEIGFVNGRITGGDPIDRVSHHTSPVRTTTEFPSRAWCGVGLQR